ncbi:Proline-rich receptor-like protein kinase [Nymphaea thermarum]|nr:Proline-rich receptor-like protein kinase [Nymphaea thermarum]
MSGLSSFVASLLLLLLLLLLVPCSTALTNIFNFTSFADGDQRIKRLGDAFVTMSNALDLTSNSTPRSGSSGIGWAVYNPNITLYDSATGFVADFQSIFSFEIVPPENTCTGDGLAFFIAHANWSENKLIGGEGLGLFNTTLGAVNRQIIAIEFDTYGNEFDPSGNHMGIDVNSSNSTVTKDWTPDDSRSLNGTAVVEYNTATGNLSSLLIYGNATHPLNISLHINITTVLPETVVVGFSASIGSCLEAHQIKAWSFSATDPPPPITPPTSNHPPTCYRPQPYGQDPVIIRLRKKSTGRLKEEENGFADVAMNFETGPRKSRYRDLAAATNDFSEEGKLGQGGFGGVYRGILRDTNEVVAVKRFSNGSSQGKKEYVAEVTVISRLRHRNLVRLIGWCHERGEFLLVYEYMEGGSLDSHLFSKQDCGVLPWSQRRKVVLGLASAVSYLHEEWEQCAVHRDIKLSNIMVDSEFNARLGDFGLARLTNHGLATKTTVVAGTMGYLAPECVIAAKVSTQSDVYSFGVVLLEIATGRMATRPIIEKGARLVEWIWELYGNGSFMMVVDERLGSEFDQQEMERTIAVGLWCVHPDPERRPTMREAIRVLSFQAGIPNLPRKMPMLVYAQPPVDVDEVTGSLFTTSSSETTATSTTVSSMESAEAALLQSRG